VSGQPASGRIVHCADYGGPYAGSFVPMLAAAAGVAREHGYATTICFSEVAQERPWLDDLRGVADISFIERSGTRGNLRQLQHIVSAWHGTPVLLHTHFGTFDEAAALLRLRRRRTGLLSHWHSGNPRPVRLRSHAYGAVFGRVVSAVICVSQEAYVQARARSFPARKLVVLPNAIDLTRFQTITPEERSAARRGLGLPDDARVILHFAWNWELKGGDRLLETAALMTGDLGVTFLTVVGEGPGDAPRAELESHPLVRPLAPRANVTELYAAADVFLNCSRSEGMPYAVLEALARGLPVVASDLPVQRQVLSGLPGGRVVPARAPELADGLRGLLAFNPAQRAEHAAAARARIESSYSLDSWARRLLPLYASALRAGRHR
jgi:glycosyltransferase involved in cell wall biosynthesis